MNVSSTSRNHFKTYNATDWYSRITALMSDNMDMNWCVADVAKALHAEKSTISARLHEMCKYGDIEIAGTFRSRATGIKSRHYQLKVQPTLI